MKKPKLNIIYYDENGKPIKQDRLDQIDALVKGPSRIHPHTFRIATTIKTEADVERVARYMKGVLGIIQIPKLKKDNRTYNRTIKVGRKQIERPNKLIFMNDNEAYLQIIKDLSSRKSMEDVVQYLRECNFRVVNKQFMEELDSQHTKGMNSRFIYMTRMSRIAPDPADDVYDTTLSVAIDLFGTNRREGFIASMFHQGKFRRKLVKLPWKRKDNINFKERKILVTFPDGMSIQDRIDWRKYHFKIKAGKDISDRDKAFHDKWLPLVKNIEEYDKRLAK